MLEFAGKFEIMDGQPGEIADFPAAASVPRAPARRSNFQVFSFLPKDSTAVAA
jgi:hypothetical protein